MLLIPAHAKINLCLALRRRRPDRFHDIDTVVATIDWHDIVGLRVRPSQVTAVRLRVSGEVGDLPSADTNLAATAAHAVASVAGPLDVEVWLDKRIPSAAGLGGGSADAAAVLRGCATLLRGSAALDQARLLSLAASLGSDVPALLGRSMRRARGRGGDLTDVVAPPLHLAVAVAGSVSTAAAYAAVRPFDFEDASRVDSLVAVLEQAGTPGDDLLGSGLEPAACRANPHLDERLLALRAAVPEARWHMTGSGGAVFALAGGAAHAAELAAAAFAAGFPARACRTLGG